MKGIFLWEEMYNINFFDAAAYEEIMLVKG